VDFYLNVSDLNFYNRFRNAYKFFEDIDKEYQDKFSENTDKVDEFGFIGGANLPLMKELDEKAKNKLNEVFACGNDFDLIFKGVNCMSITTNGNNVLFNFLTAITPIIEKECNLRVELSQKKIDKYTTKYQKRKA
jgi:hypothetical protein